MEAGRVRPCSLVSRDRLLPPLCVEDVAHCGRSARAVGCTARPCRGCLGGNEADPSQGTLGRCLWKHLQTKQHHRSGSNVQEMKTQEPNEPRMGFNT